MRHVLGHLHEVSAVPGLGAARAGGAAGVAQRAGVVRHRRRRAQHARVLHARRAQRAARLRGGIQTNLKNDTLNRR